jgi:ribosomal protein L31
MKEERVYAGSENEITVKIREYVNTHPYYTGTKLLTKYCDGNNMVAVFRRKI